MVHCVLLWDEIDVLFLGRGMGGLKSALRLAILGCFWIDIQYSKGVAGKSELFSLKNLTK